MRCNAALKAIDSFAAIGALLFLIAVVTVWEPGSSRLKAEAIKRGYALHCPSDGRFAWKGECND